MINRYSAMTVFFQSRVPQQQSLTALSLIVLIALIPFCFAKAGAADPLSLPLLGIEDFEYQGAFRLPADTYGGSSLNYSEGPIEYNSDNHSLFVVGHSHHQAIAEFAIPDLVKSSDILDLNMAAAPLQSFSTVLDSTTNGNPQSINRIGGMTYIGNNGSPQLVVNGYEYYDAPGDNSHTTLVVRDSRNISGSEKAGYTRFNGGAGHTSGWISPVPFIWQSLIGSTHITGQSSGIPIISRTSVGPSAFAFNASDLISAPLPDPILTTKLLDFSLDNRLHADLSNSSGKNNLWTHLSRATFGFVVPGTRTYATLGFSGGHASGVCYKCTQDNGNLCGGYCARAADDYYHYYWLWDIADLLAVKSGSMNSYDVRPYAYGKFPTAFNSNELGGGSFDPVSGLLFLSVQRADRSQGEYSNPPIIVVYKLNPDNKPPAGNPGSGGSSETGTYIAEIGSIGRKSLVCVDHNGINRVRIDRNGASGAIRSVRWAHRFISKRQRLLRSSATANTKRKSSRLANLRLSRQRVRLCKRGQLAD